MTTRIAWVVAASLAVPMMASNAWADLAPPSSWACEQKQPGEVCALINDQSVPTGAQGVCVQSTCYSLAGPPVPWDGGPFDCPDGEVCREAGASEIFIENPWGCVLCQDVLSAPASPSESSSCSVPGTLTRTIGPWVLAGSVSILLLLKRRRRRR